MGAKTICLQDETPIVSNQHAFARALRQLSEPSDGRAPGAVALCAPHTCIYCLGPAAMAGAAFPITAAIAPVQPLKPVVSETHNH